MGTTGRGVNKRQLVIGWVAVTLSVLAASFFGIFAGRESVTEGWLMGLPHIVPMLAIILITLLSIRWPRLGGSILMLAGLCFFFSWFLVFPYSVALFIIAGLPWFFGQISSQRLAYALAAGFPMVVFTVSFLLTALFPSSFIPGV